MLNVRISPVAFMKMQTLVMGFDKEVGWFGLVDKLGAEEYRVSDILVFPQYTSGAFIDDEQDDPLEFRKWLDTLTDEEYVARRFWGHSHVNMGVSPSVTDTGMFKRFAETNAAALENRFALCVIINKRLDMFWWAYDAETKTEYIDKDINIIVEVEAGTSNVEFFEESKNLVRDLYTNKSFIFGGAQISRTTSNLRSIMTEPPKNKALPKPKEDDKKEDDKNKTKGVSNGGKVLTMSEALAKIYGDKEEDDDFDEKDIDEYGWEYLDDYDEWDDDWNDFYDRRSEYDTRFSEYR